MITRFKVQSQIFLIVIILLTLFANSINAQTEAIDSLKVLLARHLDNDTIKVDLLNKTALKFFRVNEDELYKYAKAGYNLANKLNYDKGKANSLFNFGLYWYVKSDFTQSLSNYEQALAIYQRLNNKKRISHCRNNIGLLYRLNGNYPKALENYYASLKIAKTINAEKTIAYCYNNIGIIQRDLGHDTLALNYFQKSLDAKLKLDDKRGVATSYINIGSIEKGGGNYAEALKNFKKALEISKAINYQFGISTGYKEMGEIFEIDTNYTLALEYLNKSLKIRKELGNKIGVSLLNYDIGKVYLAKKDYKSAMDFTQKSLKIIKDIGANISISEIYLQLSDIDAAQKNYQSALENYKLYKAYADTIFNEKIVNEISKIETLYKYNNEKELNLIKQQKKEAVYTEKMKRREMFIILIAVVLLISFIALTLLFYLYQTKKKANVKLNQKNREINSQREQLAKHKDILEEKVEQRTSELLIEKGKAVESEKLKTAFLNNISHEFRTPLNGILGFSSLLVDSDLTEEERLKYSNIVKESCDHLLNIVDDTIEISEVHSNQIVISKTPTNISEIISTVINELRVSAQLKNLKINVDIQLTQKQQIVLTDEYKIKRFFWHLINNAIKFTNDGYINITGKITENNQFLFTIEDTGIGISDEMLKVIFEPFRQVETDTTRNYGGNGVGLALSKAYIELLGGSIWIKSKLNKGTTVFFTFPAEFSPISTSTIKEKPKKDLGKKTILVAEDNELNYILIHEFLSGENFDLIHAWNGKEALEKFKKAENIDLILMDIKMPVMNGHEAYVEIRKINNKVPIIAQTAYSLSQDISKINETGFNAYINKPLNKQTLIDLINKTILLSN